MPFIRYERWSPKEAARGMVDWARHELRVRTLQEYHEGVSDSQLSLPL